MLHSSPYAAQFPVRVLPWRAVWSSASACQTLHRPIPPFQPFIYRLAADSISSCCFRHRVFLCIRNVPLTILRFRVTLSLQSLSLLWLLVPGSPNITISVQALLLFSVTYVLYLNNCSDFRRKPVRASNIGYTFGCLHEGLGKRFGCAAGASPRSGAVTSRPGTVQPPGSVTSCRGRVSRSCWTAAGSRPAVFGRPPG